MKFNIEVDMTPEELRRFLGWPDVQEFQSSLLDMMQNQLHEGMDTHQLSQLMNQMAAGSMKSWETMQNLFFSMMADKSGKGSKDSKD